MKKEMPAPPTTLSALLRLAVKDARKVAKMKTRRLDMSVWHELRGRICAVCMAGAVMDRTLAMDPREDFNPYNMPARWGYALDGINKMRVGLFTRAWGQGPFTREHILALGAAALLVSSNMSERLHRAPWRVYLKAADILEGAGL